MHKQPYRWYSRSVDATLAAGPVLDVSMADRPPSELKRRFRSGVDSEYGAYASESLTQARLHDTELAHQKRDVFGDAHEYNTVVITEHGEHTVAEINERIDDNRDPDPGVYGVRETFAFDERGNPIVAREQQHLIERIALNKRLRPYFGKWVMLIVQIVWNVVQWCGILATIYLDGFDVYTHYFTNWMWTIGTVYNTVDILGFLDPSGRFHFFWIAAAFWPVFSNVAQVFWLVFVMICDNPDVIASPASEYGFCPVLLVDRIKHVVPFFERLLYIWLRSRDFKDVLYTVSVYGWRAIAVYIVLQFVFAHFVLFGYWSNFDFYAVYGLSINVWIGLVLVETLYLLFLVVPVMLFTPWIQQFWDDMEHIRYRDVIRFELDVQAEQSVLQKASTGVDATVSDAVSQS